MLLALLLRDLGVGSAVFYFIPEDHMTAGISALAPYDYKSTGYAFIKATEPGIITYDGSRFDFGTVSSKPEVILVGTGLALAGTVGRTLVGVGVATSSTGVGTGVGSGTGVAVGTTVTCVGSRVAGTEVRVAGISSMGLPMMAWYASVARSWV